MRERTFTYSASRQVVSTALPLFLAAGGTLLAVVPGWAFINNDFTFPADSNYTVEGYLFYLLLGVPFFLLLSVMVHLMYPALRVRDDAFRIETLLYRSAWLPWSAIKEIRAVGIIQRDRMLGVLVDEIHPLYSLVGFMQVMPGRGFLIHATIAHQVTLLKVLRRKRPDLFSQPE